MSRLFERKVKLTVADARTGEVEKVIDQLQVEFDVYRTLEWEVNTMDAAVYNLNAESRKLLENPKPQIVTLEVGYGDNLQVIFVGRTRTVRTDRQGPDIVTRIEAHDGRGKDAVWARRSFPKGATIDNVFRYLIDLVGLGEGNLVQAIDKAEAGGLPRTIRTSMRVRGYGVDQLAQLANSFGLQFIIQNEECLFLKYGEPQENLRPPEISSATGLHGTPSVDNEGVMSLDCLLIPNVFPGNVVDVRSEFVEGTYRVITARYSGSVWGANFMISIEGKRTQT